MSLKNSRISAAIALRLLCNTRAMPRIASALLLTTAVVALAAIPAPAAITGQVGSFNMAGNAKNHDKPSTKLGLTMK
jgi:hypothetical protein